MENWFCFHKETLIFKASSFINCHFLKMWNLQRSIWDPWPNWNPLTELSSQLPLLFSESSSVNEDWKLLFEVSCCCENMCAGQLLVRITGWGIPPFIFIPRNCRAKSEELPAQLMSASLILVWSESKLSFHSDPVWEVDWPLVVDRVLAQSQTSKSYSCYQDHKQISC